MTADTKYRSKRIPWRGISRDCPCKHWTRWSCRGHSIKAPRMSPMQPGGKKEPWGETWQNLYTGLECRLEKWYCWWHKFPIKMNFLLLGFAVETGAQFCHGGPDVCCGGRGGMGKAIVNIIVNWEHDDTSGGGHGCQVRKKSGQTLQGEMVLFYRFLFCPQDPVRWA